MSGYAGIQSGIGYDELFPIKDVTSSMKFKQFESINNLINDIPKFDHTFLYKSRFQSGLIKDLFPEKAMFFDRTVVRMIEDHYPLAKNSFYNKVSFFII